MIRDIVVAGGTHGNEYTGVWCIQHLDEQLHLRQQFPSLEVKTLLANPAAFHRNQRFVDTDLNREFTMNKLSSKAATTVEGRRAQELNAQFGPKEHPQTDLIIDLHSTTSSMGVTLIVSESDHLMAQAAAYVLKELQKSENSSTEKQYGGVVEDEAWDSADDNTRRNDNGNTRRSSSTTTPPPPLLQSQILMHAIPDRMQRPNLSSVARHGFTIEVGPVPQGVLRHDAVQHTLAALFHVLDFIEHYNKNNGDNDGDDDSNNSYLAALEAHYADHRVPCFRSAQAVAKGELSGKIPWPSHPENPNFPAYVVHASLQDRK